MKTQKISHWLDVLLADLKDFEFLEALAVLAAILAVSWWISRRVRGPRFSASASLWRPVRDFGESEAKRVAFPLIALVLLSLVRKILPLSGWHATGVLDLAAPFLLAWLLANVFVYVLRCIFVRGKSLRIVERFMTIVIWGVMALDMTGLGAPVIEALRQIHVVVGKQRLDAWMLLSGVTTVGITLLFALWVGSLIERRLMLTGSLDPNLREVMGRVAKALLALIALLVSLSLVGIDITALSVFSGALAVGLGFGLQKIASNYVSGFIILLDRSVQLGNLIALDDSTTGTISRITTRYTVLTTLGGTEVIIPNEYMVSNIVKNLSYTNNRVRVSVQIQVGYDTDVEQFLPKIVELAQKHPRVLPDPAPGAMVTQLAENGIQLDLGFWLADAEKGTGGVRSEIYLALLRYCRENGIEIPFPQRELRMRQYTQAASDSVGQKAS